MQKISFSDSFRLAMVFSGKSIKWKIWKIMRFFPVIVYITYLIFPGNSIKARGVDLERHTGGGCAGGEFREVNIKINQNHSKQSKLIKINEN